MHKLLLLISVCALVMTACQKQETVYTLEQVFAQADSLAGDTILFEGTVSHICKHGGCKAFFRTQEGRTLRVEAAEAGHFTPECINNTVRVRGLVKSFVKKPIVQEEGENTHESTSNCESEKAALYGYYAEAVSYEIIIK